MPLSKKIAADQVNDVHLPCGVVDYVDRAGYCGDEENRGEYGVTRKGKGGQRRGQQQQRNLSDDQQPTVVETVG